MTISTGSDCGDQGMMSRKSSKMLTIEPCSPLFWPGAPTLNRIKPASTASQKQLRCCLLCRLCLACLICHCACDFSTAAPWADLHTGSVSFGATRRFLFRRNCDHTDKWSYDLSSGDVLIMKGSTQQHWTHSIPKMLRVTQPRINLTFRQIVQPDR